MPTPTASATLFCGLLALALPLVAYGENDEKAAAAAAAALAGDESESWVEGVRASFLSSRAGPGEKSDSCHVTAHDACSIKKMKRDESYVVYPGGDTRCIYSSSTPFGFQVIPGDADKLLFTFQGGGACWDAISTKLGACSTDAEPDSKDGWMDRSNPANPFVNHTVVHVLYCSGDVHGGNVTRPYNDKNGQPVVQRGYLNARAAVDWAKANLLLQEEEKGEGGDGAKKKGSKKLSSVVLGGCSAGSIGVQVWASLLLSEFSYEYAAVAADSYVGVFPEGTEGPLIAGFGFCSTPLIMGDAQPLREACDAQQITLPDLLHDAMDRFPRTAFSHVQSKYDVVQREYYAGVAATNRMERPLYISKAEFANQMNDILANYSERHSNYVSFVVTSDQHCYTPYDWMYTADTAGPHKAVDGSSSGGSSSGGSSGGGGDNAPVSLVSWLGHLPVGEGASAASACDGPVLSKDEWTGDDYCDAAQYGKVFTLDY